MTREEFIAGYCERSGVTWEFLSTGRYAQVALPCACGDESCGGWAMISADPLSVKTHNELYAPETAP